MNLSPAAWALMICLFCWSCNTRTDPGNTPGINFPPEIDTAKLRQGTAHPDERTLLRIMMGYKLKPNGYFFGPAGVLPNGVVYMDVLKQSPTYTKEGSVKIYYRYLEEGGDSTRPISKVDTFTFHFGPKDH